ncbi:MAG: sugar transferase [Lachnospiraceae bacterium]|nr:sugar transferase [Lachnospiraceae bacterium]
MYKRSNTGWLKHIDFILLDAVSLQIAFVLAYLIRNGMVLPYGKSSYRTLAITLVVVDFLIAAIFNTMHNVLKRRVYYEFIQTVKQVVIVFAVTVLYMFSLQIGDVYSRIIMFLIPALHFIIGFSTRLMWKKVVKKKAVNKLKATVILVADEGRVPEILSRVKPTDDIRYTGIVLSNRNGTGEELEGLPIVSDLDGAADYICREWVDEVFIYPDEAMDVDDFIDQCRQMSVPVHIRLTYSGIAGKSFIEKVGGYNVITTASNYASPLQLALKRIFDIVGGLVGSIIAIFVILAFAPRIKHESPGPILFKQTRIGRNGQKFKCYKIRSMHVDAEARKEEYLAQNRNADGMMFKLDWDPRIIGNKIVDGKYITGLGEKMRAGSWDEWPQFFNVLMGQMSLVGTRPPTVDEWERYKYHHRARLAFKPGITGLWQVSGRSKITDFEEVVKLDTEYINNWGISLDMKILIKTIKVVMKKDGAM